MRVGWRLGQIGTRGRGTEPITPPPQPQRSPDSQWFWDHYDNAAGQILEAFGGEELTLTGKAVADIGCGDGFMDLGVLHKARPGKLVGYDLNKTNLEHLRRRAAEEGVDAADTDNLYFERSAMTAIPADSGVFDYVFSWSAFEHVSRPIDLLKEIRRVLASDGAFFLQLWPFYHSAKGSHLWDWFPEDHHHLQQAECDVVEAMAGRLDVRPPDWTKMMRWEFEHLNRITVDELQRSILAAGFVTRRIELLTGATRLTPELGRYSWLDLAISGIKLIATPA
jgi:SAM-dependent methyltransferase